MRLKGRSAVVSGGATGIGEAIVRAMVREGAATTIIDLDRQRGPALAAELTKSGSCHFFCGSINRESDCAAVIQEAESKFGPVSILVNNAAKFVFRSVEATVEEWRQSLDTNVIGTSLMTRFGAESMKRAGGGAIVNLGSISSFVAQPATMTYNATKAAVVEMTRCMALDLAPFSIRVNAICPGYIVTPAFKAYVEGTGVPREEFEGNLCRQTILKRMGKPEEIATCVVFLCSGESSYVTGAALMADGGLTAL